MNEASETASGHFLTDESQPFYSTGRRVRRPHVRQQWPWVCPGTADHAEIRGQPSNGFLSRRGVRANADLHAFFRFGPERLARATSGGYAQRRSHAWTAGIRAVS